MDWYQIDKTGVQIPEIDSNSHFVWMANKKKNKHYIYGNLYSWEDAYKDIFVKLCGYVSYTDVYTNVIHVFLFLKALGS